LNLTHTHTHSLSLFLLVFSSLNDDDDETRCFSLSPTRSLTVRQHFLCFFSSSSHHDSHFETIPPCINVLCNARKNALFSRAGGGGGGKEKIGRLATFVGIVDVTLKKWRGLSRFFLVHTHAHTPCFAFDLRFVVVEEEEGA